ncbi:MAG TPA: DUF1801 domain-containing protein [Ignavibacteria bacterium]|nr:DUF1801 domain-containing protein [Ignavibacteria bacterium]
MAKNKTTETNESVKNFIAKITDLNKRKDFSAITDLIKKHTALEPKMWGDAIVGFGSYHYKYDSGREGDAPLAGISPRANSIALYLGCEQGVKEELLPKLGKHKLSGSCIHIQKLEDIETDVLIRMVKNSIAYRKKQHS